MTDTIIYLYTAGYTNIVSVDTYTDMTDTILYLYTAGYTKIVSVDTYTDMTDIILYLYSAGDINPIFGSWPLSSRLASPRYRLSCNPAFHAQLGLPIT